MPTQDIKLETKLHYWYVPKVEYIPPSDEVTNYFGNFTKIGNDHPEYVSYFLDCSLVWLKGNNDLTNWEQIKERSDLLSADSLRVLKDLPFAIHGYKFPSSDLYNFYSQFDWYITEPDVKADKSILNSRERQFVEYIDQLEKSKAAK